MVSNERGLLEVALLTAGKDKPYALGLAEALLAQGIHLDFIGSDEVSSPGLMQDARVRFFNLRRDQAENAPLVRKILRVLRYYLRLIRYAFLAKPQIFHILWNNKFECFDRTILMVLYRLLGKKVVLTAHNVNTAKRDGRDSRLNRATLRFQYALCHHIFVHTGKMRGELIQEFGVKPGRVTVIPFGINNTAPTTAMTHAQARERLGVPAQTKVLLFFGNIAPYKGLEYLISAFDLLAESSSEYYLVIAGRPKAPEDYWAMIQRKVSNSKATDRIVKRFEFVPDEETEIYFKAADVLVLPYTQIFQSGVLFLGYSFGLPVVACDVGSLKEEVSETVNGLVCEPASATGLQQAIERFFASNIHHQADSYRRQIRLLANERYSWARVAEESKAIYSRIV